MASGQNNAGGDDGPLLGWTRFEESQENAIQSYVEGVISKVIDCGHGGGYETAADVFTDYEICAKLRIKLIEEVPVLRAATFAKEYLYYYAKRIEAQILNDLRKFVTRPYPNQLQWILLELKEELDFFKEVEAEDEGEEDGLSQSQHCINHLDSTVNMMDDNFKSDVITQREEHSQVCQRLLQEFQQSQDSFQAYLEDLVDTNVIDDNVQREIRSHIQSLKKSCQDVKATISGAEVDKRPTIDLAVSCIKRLRYVENAISKLEPVFFRRLRRWEENDVSKKWAEVMTAMEEHHLVRKEKEEYEEAVADYETECLRVRLSSGLTH